MDQKKIRTCGIICEYNPFHLGHHYHLQQAKKNARADLVVCILSGPFTQRGTAALFSPRHRAHHALLNGADVVFELPVAYALREAEHFALGGILGLAALGVDALSFGCENENLTLLQSFAVFLNNPPPLFNQTLRDELKKGLSFPVAQSNALALFFSKIEVAIMAHPNNILAVAYLRAIDKINFNIALFPVKRIGHYHAATLNGPLPSATAVRSAIYRRDWAQIEHSLPKNSYELLKSALLTGDYHPENALDLPLLYCLHNTTPEYLKNHFSMEPGLEHKIINSAKKATNKKELIDFIKSKRYTHVRINRLLSQILLNMTDELLGQISTPVPLRLLGFKQSARPWLGQNKNLFYTKAAKVSPNASFLLDMAAYDLWAIGANIPKGLGYTQSPIAVE